MLRRASPVPGIRPCMQRAVVLTTRPDHVSDGVASRAGYSPAARLRCSVMEEDILDNRVLLPLDSVRRLLPVGESLLELRRQIEPATPLTSIGAVPLS